MGRYYDGTISGKFWFGIQDSHDASNFKNLSNFTLPETYYVYYVCCCEVVDKNKYYCHDCFSDYNSHLYSMDDDDKLAIDSKLLAFNVNSVMYKFDESELELIDDKLQELENIIGNNLIKKLDLKIEDEENYFEYNINYSALDGINDETFLKIIARWCFGKQIKKAIINVGYCNINCEL
jgi:hypothetical protein